MAIENKESILVNLMDITRSKELESLLRIEDKMASLGRVAAGIAHEVKNPLGGIRGAAELLERRSEDAKTQEVSALIVREATRIATEAEATAPVAQNLWG